MMRIIGLVAVVGLAGCLAPNYRERGVHYLQAGQPAQAVRQFEQAMSRQPELTADPVFVANYRRARALAAHQQAEAAAQAGDWQRAIDALQEATTLFPEEPSFAQAHSRISRQAARDLFDRALSAADNGRRQETTELLQEALRFDPAHDQAQEALTAKEPPRRQRDDLRQAQDALQQRRWPQARELLQQVVRRAPTFVTARFLLHDAQAAEDEARRLLGQGQTALRQRHLAEARAAFSQGLQKWPELPGAASLLADVEADLAAVEQNLAQAEQLAAKEQYDDALALVKEARDLAPHQSAALRLQEQLIDRAAAACVRQAQTALEQAKLGEARQLYRRALTIKPSYEPARRGLASADAAAARQAARADRPGEAWLWYYRANQQLQDAPYASEQQVLARQVQAATAMPAVLQVSPGPGQLAVPTAHLEAAMQSRLTQLPPVINLQPAPSAERQRLTITASLRQSESERQLLRNEARTHPYTVEEQVPNPELPRLQFRLTQAERELERLKRDYERRCRHCDGSGQLTCPTCHGTNTITCTTCNGSGKLAGGAACRHCRGDGNVTCRQCRDGRLRCRRCQGTGRDTQVTPHQIRRQEREVARAQEAYDQAPSTTSQPKTAYWPYRLKTYQRASNLAVHLQILDHRDPRRPRIDTLYPFERTHQDTTVDNPNPEIGLPINLLDLPSEATARDQLIDEAAEHLIALVRQDLLQLQLTRFDQALTDTGTQEGRRNLQVHRLMLLRELDPEAAETLLNSLLEDLP